MNWLYLGKSYLSLKRRDEAKHWLQKVAESEPTGATLDEYVSLSQSTGGHLCMPSITACDCNQFEEIRRSACSKLVHYCISVKQSMVLCRQIK